MSKHGLPDIEPFRERCRELDNIMSQPDYYQDGRKAAVVGREQQMLTRLFDLYDRLDRIQIEISDNRQLAEEVDGDPEIQEMAREELDGAEACYENLKSDVLSEMIPPESSDSRNTVIEIRAGAGGDEASLFSSHLYRMYSRFAERNGWNVETLSASPSECGGFKEIVFLVTGTDVYRTMKFESGVHRVQRVPVTEANGRIHTSTATVAVLPEAEDVDIEVSPDELEITVARASGPGGQGVNTTDSAVQILHKPTGIIVKCADERSQLKNKTRAMKVLLARLLEKKETEEREKYAAKRRDQVGSGDRSERIRTYNFPQGRITDHRIGLTLYNLEEAMDGSIVDIITQLQKADKELKIKELMESPERS